MLSACLAAHWRLRLGSDNAQAGSPGRVNAKRTPARVSTTSVPTVLRGSMPASSRVMTRVVSPSLRCVATCSVTPPMVSDDPKISNWATRSFVSSRTRAGSTLGDHSRTSSRPTATSRAVGRSATRSSLSGPTEASGNPAGPSRPRPAHGRTCADSHTLGQGSDCRAGDAQESQREAYPPGRPFRAVERLDPHPHGDDQHDGHMPRRCEQGHEHQRPTRPKAPRCVRATETECVAVGGAAEGRDRWVRTVPVEAGLLER
jgi:hypothetical protein